MSFRASGHSPGAPDIAGGRRGRELMLLRSAGVVALAIGSAATAPAQLARREFTELHMGMAVRIVLHAADDSTARDAARAGFARIAALEDVMSDYRPSSELRRLVASPAGRPVSVSADLCVVLAGALEMARESDGAFDPTVAPLVALWRKAKASGMDPSPDSITAARRRVGWRRVRLDRESCEATLEPGTELDLGGVAKGYIIDQAMTVLRNRGIASALIEAGGDIVVGEAPPGETGWQIGVPHTESRLVARASSLIRAAISTSGDREQFVEIGGRRYSHIIDPRTGLGSTTEALATVIAPNAMTADALATALAVLGDERAAALLARHPGAIAVVR